MFIKQADIFWGLDKEFIKDLMDLSVKESHNKGEYLFKEGDPTNNFYILLKGCVRLGIGEGMDVVYIVRHAGEAFGWSGMVERDQYSSSAECTENTVLLRFDISELIRAVEHDPFNGMMFYKKIAGMLGNRLINTYQMSSSWFHTKSKDSYGTGQMVESEVVL